MQAESSLTVIGHIYNGFHEKFGIPRQSGLVPSVESVIVFKKPYAVSEAFRGLEAFSHLWILWQFSECDDAKFRPTVRPPRLGGNQRVGVFATRSPYRPNGIGLSSVRLERIEQTENGPILIVKGADLMNGTPIVDIKPYITYTDSHPDAISGFADAFTDYALTVDCAPDLLETVDPLIRETLLDLLKNDPRPAYQQDDSRVYTMDYSRYTVRFKVIQGVLTVISIDTLPHSK
ncbi:MAG: tRNA (N6-threonylcarbamoyladenosine(37)-N6)-methyltransferase TrmO [Clostridia bacterium]|nr:tRNA (N6-threonylcarbamoyladenosine(37)-N6)-methyltransferase TrmO [Clostridia bacterium]